MGIGGYSLFDNFIAFSEMSSDIRWEKRGYSDIYIYNTDTKDKVRLTSNQRYFKPVFSTNGERLAVIQFDYNRVPSVVVLNSFSGEILQTIPFDRGYSILDLSWNDDDSFIALSIISKKGNQLGVIDLESEKYSSVTSWDNIQRSKVQYYGNKLIFTSSYSGIDGIYSIDLDTLKEYRVVSSRFGADYPFIYNDELIFSDYTIDGFKLNKISLDSSCFIPLAQVVKGHVDYFSPLLTEEETIPTIDNPVKYVSSNYNPNLHLININSWLINPITPVMVGSEVFNSSIDKLFFKVPEIVLFSSDYLGLMDNTFYTHYNIDRELWDFGSIGTYRQILISLFRWLPVVPLQGLRLELLPIFIEILDWIIQFIQSFLII
ncbi:MAG: hypothetical protein B6229_10805 [Spirochaetaceae bacterium 4572_7]|nr:MAG: hypothetical protein B6229_10805 [Spirochaetaceae bacterium 4572_7]